MVESQILHEASFKQQPEHQAAGVCPPEGASYWEPPFPQSLQFFILAFAAEETSSTRRLLHRNTWHDKIKQNQTRQNTMSNQVATRLENVIQQKGWHDKTSHDQKRHEVWIHKARHDKIRQDIWWHAITWHNIKWNSVFLSHQDSRQIKQHTHL